MANSDYTKDRLVPMYFKGSKPAKGLKSTAWQLVDAANGGQGADEGICSQDGVTFYKYLLTYE